MAKSKRTAEERRRREASQPERDVGAMAATAALAVVLAGTALFVDTRAAAAFDAPKRLIALAGTAVAAAAAFAFHRRPRPSAEAPSSPGRGDARSATALLALAALAAALLSAAVSPRRALALDAVRALVLLALLLPLGASRVVARGRRLLTAVFLGAAAVNAAVSVLQGTGRFRPLAIETLGGRQDTGAYAGNVGYLAITLALAGVLGLGLLLTARTLAVRLLCGAGLLLFGAGLAVNRNLTALTALLAGVAALLVFLFRRRAAIPLAAALLAAGLAVATYPPLRQRARESIRAARLGYWDALVSFRGGPWAAALEMTRERPLSGFGPGTFGAEYVPHRLTAEIHARRRFVSPLLTSSYAETHCDYLQAFADAGIPGGILAAGAVVCLLLRVSRGAWRGARPEAAIVLAVLVAGATAALAWFPLQRPVTAVPLLLAAGRAWRISEEKAAPGADS